MQEEVAKQHFKIDTSQVRCAKNNKAKLLCINSQCHQNGLMCSLQQCQCQLVHQNCEIFKLESLVKKLEKKKKPITSSILESFNCMDRIYNQAIERISKDKQWIQNQVQFFGLSENDANFAKHINEKCHDEITGALISKMIPELDNASFFEATQQDLTRYWNNKKSALDELLQRFKKLTKRRNRKLQSNITDQTQVIESFFPDFVSEYNLLFRASEHKFSSHKFRQICNGKKNTLIIARTQHGRVIGAFASGQWQAFTTAYVNDFQRKNFLFSVNLKEKYPCTSPQHGMYNNPSYGPTFGGGHDLYISDNSATAENASYSKIGHSYNLNGKFITNQFATASEFTGSTTTHFVKFTEWEVFQVQFL